MTPEIRPITESEFDAVYDCTMLTFGVPMSDADRADTRAWIELDRTFAAFDDDEVVATAGVVSLPIVVPGGAVVPAAAVTLITTAPTHRRQGLMKRGMKALLDQAVERDEPLATLWASESSIYGNLGFGPAIDATDLEIAPHQAALRPDAPVGKGRIRLYDSDAAKAIVPEVYERVTAGVPGTMIRRERDWTHIFKDVAAARDGKTATRYAVYEEGGAGRGYVRYRLTEHWRDMNAESEVEVIEFHAVDAAAQAELWRFLTSIDLVAKVKVRLARSRSRLSPLLLDPRRLRSRSGDSIWVRLLDPVAGLSARRYGVQGELVIEIEDPMGYASGRFAVDGGPEAATVARVDSTPDVVLSAESIGSAYLGMPRIEELGWAGRVEGDAGAVALFGAMMRWPVEPYCTVHF
jgi:predicted acetyltransferase